MRRRYLVGLVAAALLLLWMTVLTPGAWSDLLGRASSSLGMNGWHWPIGTEYHGGYLGWLDYNPWYREYHLGRDFRAPAACPVYAISSGIVLEVRGDVYGSVSGPGSAVLVLHRTSSGASFVALYGHLTGVRVHTGQHVLAGQLMAHVNDYEPSHLHLAIHPGTAYSASDIWRGYTPATGMSYGFVDPMSFLYKNRPDGIERAASPRSVPVGRRVL